MGTKMNPGKFDCYEAAAPDEPMFILLARDPQAPDLVEQWADERAARYMKKSGGMTDEEAAKINEAHQCAENMRAWRKANRP